MFAENWRDFIVGDVDRRVHGSCLPVFDYGGINGDAGQKGIQIRRRTELMRKKWILMTTLIFALLVGCGEHSEEKESGQAVDTDMYETNSGEEEEIFVEYGGSSTVLEDEEAVYICGTKQIRKVDKDSREVSVLWESGTEKVDMYSYAGAQAVLADGSLYFIEHGKEQPYGEQEILSMIHTDGTGYTQIEELEKSIAAMYCSGQALYIYYYWEDVQAYEIGEDGILSFSGQLSQDVPYKIPEGYRMIRGLTPFESVENYGYILLEDAQYKLVMIDPQTGGETFFGEEMIEDWNRDYFLCTLYNEAGDKELYLKDRKTLEKRRLTCFESGYNGWTVGMDESYVYAVRYQDNEGDGDYIFERIALDSGERGSFFTLRVEADLYLPHYMMDFTVCNGYAYYIREEDDAMYLMRRSTEDIGVEERLGEPYFDGGVDRIGGIETHYEALYSETKPEVILGEVTFRRIVVDEKFPGASKINRILSDYQEKCVSYEEDSVKWIDDELKEKGEEFLEMKPWYDYTSNPSGITYFDDVYFSFYQQDDDYTGGAHGMLYRTGFVFDLETGERLLLTDLIGNSEEELKELVTEYFAYYISWEPEAFWEDALETVKEGVSLDSDFYLSEEGIKFYFPPYALACFAAGFQEVTVPYEEFDMKLPIGTKETKSQADMTTADHDVNGRRLPIYCVDTKEKKIALTFDAAWGNEDTQEILEILDRHDIHATFFMTGGWVEGYPEDVKSILAAGHDLGNHSENHKNMSQLSDEEKKEEIMKVHEKVKDLTGYDMFLFRPPYGDYDNAVVDVLKECGYYGIQWDVDSLDWQNKGVDSIIETVTEHRNLGNGSIVLCHNGAEYTAHALDALIDALEAQGYEIVPLSELIYRDQYHLNYEGRQIKN